MKRDIILRKEDFHDFPIGEFPYDRDHTAAGEYHYIVKRGTEESGMIRSAIIPIMVRAPPGLLPNIRGFIIWNL